MLPANMCQAAYSAATKVCVRFAPGVFGWPQQKNSTCS